MGLSNSLAAAQQKPNVIVIMADDMGFGDVRSYTSASGQAGVNSPVNTLNIDRLATGGRRFTNAHSPSSVCTPTRYGLLTGQYAWRAPLPAPCGAQLAGVVGAYDPPMIAYDRFTMPEMLQSQGYATAAIGKWHLGNDWVTTDGQLAQTNGSNVDLTAPFRGGAVDHGFDYYFGDDIISRAPFTFIENDRVISTPVYSQVESMPEITRRAVQYVIDQSTTPEPFFLYLPLGAPHSPIVPPINGVPAMPSIGLSAFVFDNSMDNYENFIRLVDWTVGEVIDTVEENGLADDTIIIFTADNGVATEFSTSDQISPGFINGQLIRGRKSTGWEGGTRIPLLARWDGQIPAATVTDDLVELTDFYATLNDLLEVPTPAQSCEDSASFLPTLLGESWAEGRRYSVQRSQHGLMVVRQVDEDDNEWKLIFGAGGGGYLSVGVRMDPSVPIDQNYSFSSIQMYELTSDPAEQINLLVSGGVNAFELAKAQELQTQLLRFINTGLSPLVTESETLNFDFGSFSQLSSDPMWNDVPGPEGGAPFPANASSIRSTDGPTLYSLNTSSFGGSLDHGVADGSANWNSRYPLLGEAEFLTCVDAALRDGFFTRNGMTAGMAINGLVPGSVWDMNFYGARNNSGGLVEFEVLGATTKSAEISSVRNNSSETALVQDVVVPANGRLEFTMTGGSTSAEAAMNALVMRTRPVGIQYCHSTSNTTGFPARITASGSGSLTHNNLELTVRDVPEGFGLFFHAADPVRVAFGNGLLCASGSLMRLSPTFAFNGTATLPVDLPSAGITTAGTRYFQYWHRDFFVNGFNYNTSDALAIQFVP